MRSYPHTSLAVRHLKPTRTTLQNSYFAASKVTILRCFAFSFRSFFDISRIFASQTQQCVISLTCNHYDSQHPHESLTLFEPRSFLRVISSVLAVSLAIHDRGTRIRTSAYLVLETRALPTELHPQIYIQF